MSFHNCVCSCVQHWLPQGGPWCHFAIASVVCASTGCHRVVLVSFHNCICSCVQHWLPQGGPWCHFTIASVVVSSGCHRVVLCPVLVSSTGCTGWSLVSFLVGPALAATGWSLVSFQIASVVVSSTGCHRMVLGVISQLRL